MDFAALAHGASRTLQLVHPLKGMTNGTGWVLGRTLHLSELYYRLEQVHEIDHVTRLEMSRAGSELAGRPQERDRIAIGPRSYPVFDKISISQAFD